MIGEEVKSEEERLEAIWRQAWTPPDRSPPWKWAEKHCGRIPYSNLPGRFRSDNSPWMREPMEVLVDPRVKECQIMAAIQASKTLLMELGSAYIISNMPGPMLWLGQQDDEAKDHSVNRLQPLYAEIEPVKRLLHPNRHRVKTDTVSYINGMTQWMRGAMNKTNLQTRSIRWLLGDETWRWPAGHMEEAKGRTTAFGWLGKCFFVSQAGEWEDDTHLQWLAGDQRTWNFRCPHCGEWQPYSWDQMRWDSVRLASGARDYTSTKASVRYACATPNCGAEFEDTDRNRLLLSSQGKFVAMNPGAPPDMVSFHWNGMASTSWAYLVQLYLQAKDAAKKGDLELLKIFYQKRLALPWTDELEDFKMEIEATYEAPEDLEVLWDREGRINRKGRVLPAFDPTNEDEDVDRRAEIPLRFMTVDVQMDHFWVVVRSWSDDGSSRLARFRGGNEGDESVIGWEELRGIQKEFGVADHLVFVDAGYSTSTVYDKCATYGWTALMGQDRAGYIHTQKSRKSKRMVKRERYYSPVRRVDRGNGRAARVHYYSNLNAKDILNRLRQNQDPGLGPTWEVFDGVSDEYLRQMESEQRVKKGTRWIWEQIGKRHNHGWDCEVMQIVAALMLKLVGQESIDPVTSEGAEE